MRKRKITKINTNIQKVERNRTKEEKFKEYHENGY